MDKLSELLHQAYRNLSMEMRHLRQKFSVPPDRFLEAPVC
jgi:hypothetical protein